MAEALEEPVYNDEEMKWLCTLASQKASEHSGWINVHYFYRDMLSSHEEALKESGILQVAPKYSNGHPRCPARGMAGRFFSTNVHHPLRQPVPYSLYGDRRVLVPTATLIDRCPYLYFADFYCYDYGPRAGSHHVSLVMTNHLLDNTSMRLLSWDSNPFLRNDGEGQVTIPRNGIWLEIFFNQDLELDFNDTNQATWEDVESKVTSEDQRSGPKPKNSKCKICNIPAITN